MFTSLIPIRDDNPYRRFPIVTVGLIAVNVWVFATVGAGELEVFRYGAIPCDVVGRCDVLARRLDEEFPGRAPLLTLFTSMFMHGSWAHLLGNMLYLWVFGNNVEDRLGRVRYLLFYLVCGLAAAFAHIAVSSSSQIPVVGASGAVSGVLGAYLVFWPHARVLTLVSFFLFLPYEVSAGFLLVFWFAMQLLAALAGIGSTQGAGVAFFAHIGGFAAGWLLVRVIAPPIRKRDPVEEWFRT